MFVSVTALDVAFEAVTGTVIVHEVEPAPAGAAARLPPVMPKLSEAVFAVALGQLVVAVPAVVSPVGSVSVKSSGDMIVLLKLAIFTVSVEVPPLVIDVGEKDFVTCALV